MMARSWLRAMTAALALSVAGLVWGQTPVTGRLAYVVAADGPDSLWVVDLPGGTPRQIAMGQVGTHGNLGTLSWFPDGKRIAFGGGTTSNSQIYAVDIQTQVFHQVTDGVGDIATPDVFPGGSRVLYHGVYGHIMWVDYVAGQPGTNPVDTGVNGSHARISPDERKIVFSNWGFTYQSDLFVLDISQGPPYDNPAKQTNITETMRGASEAFIWADWAPDSSTLVVNKKLDNDKSEIGLLVWNGTSGAYGFTNLTNDPDVDQGVPSWAPDGGIVFLQDGDIWYMKADGTGRQNLTNTPAVTEYWPVMVGLGPIRKPFTFTPGTPAKSSEVNADFDVLYEAVNALAAEVEQLKAEVTRARQAK